MDAAHNPEPGPSSGAVVVEYRKDGGISRMRSHKGNVPQLPQTKLCPYCPAKFTRTTHLNRHLRNHTNERLYRCETCGAQFTRSDLLSRHKKSCGEAHPISRSRRRSCQACASLKVKCDLRQPCAKCRARGRDCLYQGESPLDPPPVPASPRAPHEQQQQQQQQQQQHTRQHARASAAVPQGIVSVDASAGFDPWAFARPYDGLLTSAFPELELIEEANDMLSGAPLNEANIAHFGMLQPPPPPHRQHHRQHRSPASHARSLPNVDFAAPSEDSLSSYAPLHARAFTSFVPSDISGPIAGTLGAFDSNMFEPFFRDVFSAHGAAAAADPATPSMGQIPVAQTSLEGIIAPPNPIIADALSFWDPASPAMIDPLDEQLMYDLISNTLPADGLPIGVAPPTVPEAPPKDDLPPVVPKAREPEPVPDPTTEELQHYLYIFLTVFLPQIPVVHTPTLRVELKPPVMLRAMQACGALFVRTRTADAFVEQTLERSRDVLVGEFAKPSPDPKHHLHIIITVILLQTIGIFHQDPEQRAASSIYHGMLVLMIRQSGIVNRCKDWTHKPFSAGDPDLTDVCWRDWAINETIKRAILLAYSHDQAHPIYFSLPPSFHASECQLYLPCDEALWTAPSARAWAQLVLAPSPYGEWPQRIRGVSMPRALAAIGADGVDPSSGLIGADAVPEHLAQISPMGHFIVIHAILAMLFSRLKLAQPASASAPPQPSASEEGSSSEPASPHVFAIQLALHKWLQIWMRNPESPRPAPPKPASGGGGGGGGGAHSDPAFMSDPLPFYWLAQLLLLAHAEALPPFDPPAASASASPGSSSDTYRSPPSLAASPPSSASLASSASPSTSAAPPSPAGIFAPAFLQGHDPLVAARQLQTDASARQFTLVRAWLHRVKLFLRRSGAGDPTMVWDELMKIRLRGWRADALPERAEGEGADVDADVDADADYAEQGLLGFFEEKLQI